MSNTTGRKEQVYFRVFFRLTFFVPFPFPFSLPSSLAFSLFFLYLRRKLAPSNILRDSWRALLAPRWGQGQRPCCKAFLAAKLSEGRQMIHYLLTLH